MSKILRKQASNTVSTRKQSFIHPHILTLSVQCHLQYQ